jgi:hypothetical protein
MTQSFEEYFVHCIKVENVEEIEKVLIESGVDYPLNAVVIMNIYLCKIKISS